MHDIGISNRFEVQDKAIEAAGIAIGLAMRVPAPLRSIADQLVRSASSVPANLAEGNGRSGRDRLHHFRIALASARDGRVEADVPGTELCLHDIPAKSSPRTTPMPGTRRAQPSTTRARSGQQEGRRRPGSAVCAIPAATSRPRCSGDAGLHRRQAGRTRRPMFSAARMRSSPDPER